MAKKMSSKHMKEYEHFSPKQLKKHMGEEKKLVKTKELVAKKGKPIPAKKLAAAAKKPLKKMYRGK
jgi:hypothetical protein